MYPRARRTNLTVNLQEETVIYDERTQQAHYLNGIAAEVWLRCDGKSDAAAIAASISKTLGTPCHVEAVHLALEQLSRRDLLLQKIEPPSRRRKIDRRETLKRLAMAMALPLIISLLARTAVSQTSPAGGDGGADGGGADGGGADGGGADGGGADGGGADGGGADGGGADAGGADGGGIDSGGDDGGGADGGGIDAGGGGVDAGGGGVDA